MGNSNRVILLIEDDPETLSLLEKSLGYAHFAILPTDSVAKALDVLSSSHPDLIIADMGLPDGTGLDVLRNLRTQGNPVPFIVLTARGDIQSKLEAFKAGAQDYIQKPFVIEELLARVNVHLPLKNPIRTNPSKEINEEIVSRVHQDMLDMTVHDLKVPLASIKGSLDIINSRGLVSDDWASQLLAHAGESANYMLLMVNNLLDLSQYEEQGLQIQMSRFPLPEVMAKIGKLFEGVCLRREVKIIYHLDSNLKEMETDENLFLRVLVNLVSNAVKFSPKGGSVEIRGLNEGDAAVFSILDQGPGLSESARKNLFKKYTESSRAVSGGIGGTGIGLAFCKIAVDALQGRISGDNLSQGGSVFTVRIPMQVKPRTSSCLLANLCSLTALSAFISKALFFSVGKLI